MSAALLLGTPAGAAHADIPYTPGQPQLFLNLDNGHITLTLVLKGNNFLPFEFIQVDIHSKQQRLAALSADARGNFTRAITLPANLSCEHTIVATGLRSHRSASAAVMIQPCNHLMGQAMQADEPTSDAPDTVPVPAQRQITTHHRHVDALAQAPADQSPLADQTATSTDATPANGTRITAMDTKVHAAQPAALERRSLLPNRASWSWIVLVAAAAGGVGALLRGRRRTERS